jgi:transcriptional regulator with XRE-family HTH domain
MRNGKITGRMIAAARALAGVSQADFAFSAGLSLPELQLLEASGSARLSEESDRVAVCKALDYFGVVIIDEEDGMGAGVRLKFSRTDVRQLTRLESEGGAVGADDAP